MTSPVANLHDEEQSLLPIFWAGGTGLLATLRDVPDSVLRRAIRTGRIGPVSRSEYWREALAETKNELMLALLPILLQGAELGVLDVPGFSPQARQLRQRMRQLARGRASGMVTDLDRKTRSNLRRMLRNASRQYQRNRSRGELRRLAEELREKIGLTTAQAQGIERRGEVEAERVESKLGQRAATMAAFGAVAGINFGMLGAWQLAQDEGALGGDARKQWRSMGDGNTRARHRAQGEREPIPLDHLYPLFGVLAPPAPEPRCRCWHVLVR